jgi:hypothetical protein
MTHSFLAYIDEAGDDGLAKYREPGKHGGSSHWLILSACIIRKTNSLEAVSWRNEILSKTQREGKDLHFVNLNHGQRVVAAQCLSEKPIRITNVLAAKKPIPDGIYGAKNQLYFYMTKYLIERISWLCRDLRPRVPEGNGQVAITFSRRGGMSYNDFRDYLLKLKENKIEDVRIHWPVIDINAVYAQDHSRIAALQLADVAASAASSAVEYDRYGNCEDRYLKSLKPITYNNNGKFLGYGIKFVPKHQDCGLCKQQSRVLDEFK